jgi:hypothetical protein
LWRQDVSQLDDDPRDNNVGDAYLEDVTAFEFVKKRQKQVSLCPLLWLSIVA